MNYLDASIRGIKFQKKNKFQIPKIKNKIRCKHRGIKPLEIKYNFVLGMIVLLVGS
jgi:hypothetical protein